MPQNNSFENKQLFIRVSEESIRLINLRTDPISRSCFAKPTPQQLQFVANRIQAEFTPWSTYYEMIYMLSSHGIKLFTAVPPVKSGSLVNAAKVPAVQHTAGKRHILHNDVRQAIPGTV
jgi:hypothetical protein